jgi:hypothetical protein
MGLPSSTKDETANPWRLELGPLMIAVSSALSDSGPHKGSGTNLQSPSDNEQHDIVNCECWKERREAARRIASQKVEQEQSHPDADQKQHNEGLETHAKIEGQEAAKRTASQKAKKEQSDTEADQKHYREGLEAQAEIQRQIAMIERELQKGIEALLPLDPYLASVKSRFPDIPLPVPEVYHEVEIHPSEVIETKLKELDHIGAGLRKQLDDTMKSLKRG